MGIPSKKKHNIIILNILLYFGLSSYLLIPIFLMRISVAFKEYDVIISNKSNVIEIMYKLSFKDRVGRSRQVFAWAH